MTSGRNVEKAAGPDEGWTTLRASGTGLSATSSLFERVVEACEKSGWPAISCSPAPGKADVDPGRDSCPKALQRKKPTFFFFAYERFSLRQALAS